MRPIIAVCGTRPEAVKLAPVLRALKARGVKTALVSTGQHRGLLDQTFPDLGLRAATDLRLMRPGQDHGALAARILAGLSPLLKRLNPELVLVQGDSTTAAAAALACHYAGVPVGHVEAGLRTGDRENPFPEEGNRVIADHLSALHFAPTREALSNLRREGLAGRWAKVTGNTVVDAVRWATEKAGSDHNGSILVTFHRRESFGKPLEEMLKALERLVAARPAARVDLLVHPNPNVRRAVAARPRHPRIRRLGPQPYLAFVRLLSGCSFVITDSGGLQEEAAALGKPVLVARDTTERPELIAAGGGLLVGRGAAAIAGAAARLLDDPRLRRRMAAAKNPFGDGRAGERIAGLVLAWRRRAA